MVPSHLYNVLFTWRVFVQDLRHLIDSMLQKSPAMRPSVNTILRKPFIQVRVDRSTNYFQTIFDPIFLCAHL